MSFLSDSAGKSLPIRLDCPTRVGRDPDNDIVLEHASVSQRHATIVRTEGRYYVRDLDSQNGTFVSERKISDAELSDGDRIRFGNLKLTFQSEESSPPRRANVSRAESLPGEPIFQHKSYYHYIPFLFYVVLVAGLAGRIAFYARKNPGDVTPIVASGVTLAGIAYLCVRGRWLRIQAQRALDLEGIDRLSGAEFEVYMARIFEDQGYRVENHGGLG
jgi:hypothetical protein